MAMQHVMARSPGLRGAGQIGRGQQRLSAPRRPPPTPAHGRGAVRLSSPQRHTSPNQCYGTPASACALGTRSTRRCAGTGSVSYGASARRRGQLALGGPDRWFLRAVLVCTANTDSREADAMRKLTFGMNLSVDGYIAAPGDDLGWRVPSAGLCQWWPAWGGARGVGSSGRTWWATTAPRGPPAAPQRAPTPANSASPR